MKSLLIFIVPGILISSSFAQSVSLVKDINTSSSSFARSLVVYKDLVYFVADDGIHGDEIWQTNGTAAGTKLVYDFRPGALGSDPASLYVYNDMLFFIANNGSSGVQLWRTTGSLRSTVQLTNVPHGNVSSPIIGNNGLVFFTTDDGIHGGELWVTDGTAVGTHMVKDITPGGLGSFPTDFTIFKNKLYFVGNAPIDTRALYVSDGTLEGTQTIFNCNEEGCRHPTVFKGQLFFISDDSLFSHPNTELYVTDGTAAGTHLFYEINPNGSGPFGELTSSGNNLYFMADDGIHGTELWASDGTTINTHLVKDIRKGHNGSVPGSLTPYNDKIVFGAYPGRGFGTFWISDGTRKGTIMLDTIIPDLELPEIKYAMLNGKLYFNGYKSGFGYELCVTDGTPQGTGIFADINEGLATSSPSYFVNYKNSFLFSANDEIAGYELFKLINFSPANAADQPKKATPLIPAEAVY